VARALTATYLTAKYLKEMNENYEAGNWLEAAKDTGVFAVTITPVVAPAFFFGSVAFPVTVGVTAGVIGTAAVLELTGLGEWEDAVDLVLEPPTPIEWYEVVAPAVKEKILAPTVEYVTEELWQKQLVRPVSGWVDRRAQELEQGKEDLWKVLVHGF